MARGQSQCLEIMSHFNATVRHAPGGWTYRYPETNQPFPFENIDQPFWLNFVAINWKWSLYAGAIYLVTIFGLQQWMKSRPAMNLKAALFWWNLGLGLFSIAGFVRMAPGLVETLGKPNGIYRSICKRDYADTPIAFWGLMFSLSKFVELGDTVFIVLRKRRLLFLQWFHHILTLNVAWMLGPLLEPINVFAAVINYGVHALMYPYFALTSVGIKIPRRMANLITACQLGQMIFMFVINALTTYYYQIGKDCYRSPASIKGFGVLYGSFVLLFGKLFIDSVLKSGRTKKSAEKKCDNIKEE